MPAVRPSAFHLTSLDDRSTPAIIGGLDPSFGTAGRAALDLLPGGNDSFTSVAVQADGKIIAAGSGGSDAIVARFLPGGALDTTFGTNGKRVIDFGGSADTVGAVGIDASGRVIVIGTTNLNGGDFAAARLKTDGTPDATFGTNGVAAVNLGGAGAAYDGTIDSAGRLLLVGSSGGNFAATRLKTDGTLDTTFGTNGAKAISFGGSSSARAVFVDDDGKIIVAGDTDATTNGLNKDIVAVRLDANGQTLDSTFGNTSLKIGGATFTAYVIDFGGTDVLYGATRDASGRYLLIGSTTTTTATGTDFAIARTDPGFNLDSTFGTGGKRTFDVGGTDVGRSVYVQEDGRIVVAGTSTNAAGKGTFAVARLTQANGALDPSFGYGGGILVPSTGNDQLFGAAEGNDGGVVLAGSFGADAGVARLVGSVGLSNLLAVSGPAGALVKQYTAPNGTYAESPSSSFTAFPGTAASGRTAVADVTGDGTPDVVVAAGPGAPPQVLVYDGVTGKLVANVMAFEASFTGGLFVATGDFNHDGRADVVVSPDRGGGPRVRLFDGASLAANKVVPLADFLAIQDPNFRGGVRPAVGDFDGDGTPDLAVSAGTGGGPRIAVWNGKSLQTGGTPTRLVADFFAFENGLRDGAFVAAGDVDGDGYADLVFGGGPNGGPRVLAISGLEMAKGAATRTLANFFAGDPNTRGGVRVALKDADGDGKADLVTASGDGQYSAVRVYKGTTLAASASPAAADQTIDPFGTTLAGGTYVG